MTRHSVPSLRMRLGGLLALLLLTGAGLLYLAAIAYARSAADESYDRLLSGAVISIAETLSVTRKQVQVDVPYAAFDLLSADTEDSVFYRVYVSDGRTITGYGDLPYAPKRGGLRRPWDPVGASFFDAPYHGEMVRFAVLDRQTYEPGVHDRISVQVGQTRHARDAMASQLVMRAMAPILLITVLAIAFVWFGIGVALRPLSRIGAELIQRDSSDLHIIDQPAPIEVQPLVDAINNFMRRLQTNIDSLRAFIAEAAHQIRTPLAALRAQAQVADVNDMTDLQRSLRAVERNAAKLTRLVNQLLSDAIVTHRSDVLQVETFDLVLLIRQAIHETVPMSGDARARLQSDLAVAPYVGDRLLLAEATKNVIDNAIQHGGGDITVYLVEDADHFLLSVCDRGPGIPRDRHAHIWERFARASKTAGGAGLGLAIVRRAIERHGGRVELQDRDGGGLCVSFILPRQAP